MFWLVSNIFNQDLCFFIRRKGLLIPFNYCRVCFQILFEETFSMLFNLSGCLGAENFCNLHAIIAILLIFWHKYLVFVLGQFSLIHIIVWKTSRCNISCSKRSFSLIHIIAWKISPCNISCSKKNRCRKQIPMTSNCYAKRPMEYLSDKERVIKNR